MRESSRRHVQRDSALLGIQPHINLVVVEVCPNRQQRLASPKLVGMQVLSVEPFLIPGIMLLNTVAMDRIIQKESEIRIKVKQRPAQKAVGFKAVSGLHCFAV